MIKFLQICGFITRVMVALLIVFIIHEHGHYSEMKRYNVEVEEFSIGIGYPIFQYMREDKVLLSLRLIPLMAYVSPTSKGFDRMHSLHFFESFDIYVAGVRNNLFTGWVLVAGIQFLSAFRRRQWTDFFKNLLYSPFRIIILFVGFTAAFFHRWGDEIVERYQFVVYDVNENEHLNRILWWSFCLGFLNFLPIGFFDGSKIFVAPVLAATSNWWIIFLLPLISTYLALFVFMRGIRIGELVDYQN